VFTVTAPDAHTGLREIHAGVSGGAGCVGWNQIRHAR